MFAITCGCVIRGGEQECKKQGSQGGFCCNDLGKKTRWFLQGDDNRARSNFKFKQYFREAVGLAAEELLVGIARILDDP